MPDYGARVADKAIRDTERKLRATYSTAQRELQKKLDTFNSKYKARDEAKRQLLAEGKITEQDYANWKAGQVFQKKQWKAKVNEVAAVMANSNAQAARIVNEGRLDVFSENYNFIAFVGEQQLGVSFDIYNTQAVARLIQDDPQILPEWKIDEEKDYEWNAKKVNNIVQQGIIQGEGIPEITKRLCEDLATQNENKMRMFARTAMTGAQNAGRQKQMEDAADMGIKVEKQWLATLDSRTRDAHRDRDGETVPYNEEFSGGLEYPGDPAGEPADVYNCRCTMITVYPEHAAYHEGGKQREELEEYEEWSDTAYQRWVEAKQEQNKISGSGSERSARKAVDGKDITETWRRRAGQFDFEIEDVMNSQGFDGLPQVVSKEEFDRIAEESGFVAQRTYSAPDQQTLDAYRNQLYNGKWYVDCTEGGSQFGQGMYCSSAFSGKVTEGIRKDMEHFRLFNESKGNSYSNTETFTILPGSKMVRHSDLVDIMNGQMSGESEKAFVATRGERVAAEIEKLFGQHGKIFASREFGLTGITDSDYSTAFDELSRKEIREITEIVAREKEKARDDVRKENERLSKLHDKYKRFDDEGSLATALGYDAIIVEGQGSSGYYGIILNRTKLVILED